MCQSFDELPLWRQEESYCSLIGIAEGTHQSRKAVWERRSQAQRAWLQDIYEGMSTSELETHAETLRDAENTHLSAALDVVEAVLKQRANDGVL